MIRPSREFDIKNLKLNVLSKLLITFSLFIVTIQSSKSQNTIDFQQDSIKGISYFHCADSLWENVDTCLYYSHLAIPLLKKTKQWDKYIYTLTGLLYCYNAKEWYDSLEIKSLLIHKEVKRLFPPKHKEYGLSLNNLGFVYSEIKEDYLAALDLYKEAYSFLDSTSSDYFLTKAPIEENIGHMYSRLGDFQTAINYYQQSIESWQQVRVDGKIKIPHIRLAKVYNKLGQLFFSIKDFKSAKNNCLQALQILKKSVEYDQSFETRFTIDLSEINIALEEFDFALDQLVRLQKVTNLTPLQKMRIYHNKGLAYLKKKNYLQAIKHLNIALKQNISKDKVQEKSIIYRNLAKVYRAKQQDREALKYQQASVQLLAPNSNLQDNWDVPEVEDPVQSRLELFKTLKDKAITIQNIYASTEDINHLKVALKTYTYLSHLTNDIRSFYQSDESQLFLLDEAKDFYEAAISTAFQLYQRCLLYTSPSPRD